jgi:hypothetical protein
MTSPGSSLPQDAAQLRLTLTARHSFTSLRRCCSGRAGSATRLRHAFGNGFPTAEAGPGQVAWWTGEFNSDATDIEQ